MIYLVNEFLECKVSTSGLDFSGLANQPRSQVELVEAAPVLKANRVYSRSDDTLELLELLRCNGKDLVDGLANGDLTKVVAAVVLNEFKYGLSVSGLDRSE